MKKAAKRVLAASLTAAMTLSNVPLANMLTAMAETEDAAEQEKERVFPDVYPKEALEKKLDDEELKETVDALIHTMTEDEKFSLMGSNGTGNDGNAGGLPGVPRLGIPQIKMYDGPAGVLSLHDTTNPPQEQMLAATWNTNLAYGYGKIHGSENKAIGGNMQLGSQFDILRSPYFGRGKDQMGEDPYLLSQMSPELTKGIQDENVMAVGKHFAAFAINASPGTKTDVKVSDQALRETYLPAFEAAVKDGNLLGMMSSYNKINGTFASACGWLQNDILRKEWGFKGFTITDWGGNDGITLDDGTDIEMPSLSSNGKKNLGDAVKQGLLTQEEVNEYVDDAARHVLQALGQAGYLGLVEVEDGKAKEDPSRKDFTDKKNQIRLYTDEDEAKTNLKEIREENNDIAQQVAEEGGVLLKNEEVDGDKALPIRDGESVAVIGLGGKYLMSGIGGERSNGTFSEMLSPYDALLEEGVDAEDYVAIDKLGTIIPTEFLYTASSSDIEKVLKETEATESSEAAKDAEKASPSDIHISKEKASPSVISKANAAEDEEDTDAEDTEDLDQDDTELSAQELEALIKDGHGVTRTYGTEASQGGNDFFQGQGRDTGKVENTLMEGHKLGEFCQVDPDINFTTGTINGKPNRFYVASASEIEKYYDLTETAYYKADADSDEVAVDNANSFAKGSGAAYTWTTYLKAPEDGTYSLILGGIGGSISGSVSKLNGDRVGSFSISNLNQGTQWANDICGETGTILSTVSAKLEKDQYYKIEIKGVALREDETGMDKDLQLTLSWITPSEKEEEYQAALDAAEDHDVSVVFVSRSTVDLGKTREASTLALDKEQEKLIKDVAKRAHKNDHRVVVVLNNPTAVTMKNWINKVDAVLEMYYPGQRGGIATAELLTGAVNPSGRLAFTIPADDNETVDTITEEIFKTQELGSMVFPGQPGQPQDNAGGSYDYYEGILTGYKWYDATGVDQTLLDNGITEKIAPLYDFGYGLSYTTFEYSDLSVKENTEDGESAGYDVTFTIKNTGDVAGKDTAQIYLGRTESELPDNVQMAQRALAGFYKTEELQPGEETEVTVHVNERSLSYWDDAADTWTVAKGARNLYVAHSSSDDDIAKAEDEGMIAKLSVLEDDSSKDDQKTDNTGKDNTANDNAKANTGSTGQSTHGHIGGSGRSSGGSSGSRTVTSNAQQGDRSGSWKALDAQGTVKWMYVGSDQSPKYKDAWAWIYNPYSETSQWFHFDHDGNMMTGWYHDSDGHWYHLHAVSDGRLGEMETGWQMIDSKYYFFNTVSDGTKGAMYSNTSTPDGYRVGIDGAWIK